MAKTQEQKSPESMFSRIVDNGKVLANTAKSSYFVLKQIAGNTKQGLIGNIFKAIFGSAFSGIITGVATVGAAGLALSVAQERNIEKLKDIFKVVASIGASAAAIAAGVLAYKSIGNSTNTHIVALRNIFGDTFELMATKIAGVLSNLS